MSGRSKNVCAVPMHDFIFALQFDHLSRVKPTQQQRQQQQQSFYVTGPRQNACCALGSRARCIVLDNQISATEQDFTSNV